MNTSVKKEIMGSVAIIVEYYNSIVPIDLKYMHVEELLFQRSKTLHSI